MDIHDGNTIKINKLLKYHIIHSEMTVTKRYDNDTPLVTIDVQHLSKTLCVCLFELKFCFDEFGHHIE